MALLLMGILLISISYFTFRFESILLIGQFVALFALYFFLGFQKKDFSLKEIITF